jgi:hypothetical protein
MPMPRHQQALLHTRRCGADASSPRHAPTWQRFPTWHPPSMLRCGSEGPTGTPIEVWVFWEKGHERSSTVVTPR